MLALLLLLQHDHDHGDEPKVTRGELRVYVEAESAAVEISMFGAPAVRVALERAKGKRGACHAGDAREGVELVVVTPCECCQDPGGADVVYFRAPIALEVFHCGTQGHPAAEKTCSVCGKETAARPLEFTAKVIVGQRTIEGFAYPNLPRTYAEGVQWIEGHLQELRTLLDKPAHADIPRIVRRVSRIAKRLPQLLSTDEVPPVLRACLELEGLAQKMEDVLKQPNGTATEEVYKAYLERLATLKEHVHKK